METEINLPAKRSLTRNTVLEAVIFIHEKENIRLEISPMCRDVSTV